MYFFSDFSMAAAFFAAKSMAKLWPSKENSMVRASADPSTSSVMMVV
jgi:hypothetical protein